MSSLLDIQDAHQRLGATPALAGASFSLGPGECLGLLGPNGVGKTTLVRAIAGRVRLGRGSTHLHGQALDTSPAGKAARHRIGIVPQEVALYPLLTATENLQAFGKLGGLAGQVLAAKVQRALAWTELAERAREPIKHFSSGMQRRLNIACSLLHEPEVIILDEPTVGVDPQSRQRIWDMFAELRGCDASLLLTTHQLEEAQQQYAHIVIINHGQTIANGSFPDLLTRTIGQQRRVICRTRGPLPEALQKAGWELSGDSTLSRRVDDVGTALAALLTELTRANVHVAELQIESPTLQDVFLHLTGRELRK